MKLSDEQIVAALISSPTNAEAADRLGISESQLYKRMKGEQFQRELRIAQEGVLKEAVQKLQIGMTEAIAVLREIMNDAKTNDQIRVNAAATLLQNSIKLKQFDSVPTEKYELMKSIYELTKRGKT